MCSRKDAIAKLIYNYVHMLTMEMRKMAYGQGGWRRRRRNMYHLTGVPGWMRFGDSPGWAGRSPTGLSPTAQYLMQGGQVPQPYPVQATQTSFPTHEDCTYFKNGFCTLYDVAMDPNSPVCPNFTPKSSTPAPQTPPTQPAFQAPAGFPPAQMSQVPKEQEIQMLEGQARMVGQQLEQIKRRLEELKKEVK